MRPASPYLVPGFYDRALAAGRHREVTGGWWEETGRLQLSLLRAEGLLPGHQVLDIGCGALRLGCKAVPYLNPGHYWGTDASGPLMRRGWEVELSATDQARLPLGNLIEDAGFGFPGVPGSIDFAIAFGVVTHLPPEALGRALTSVRGRFPGLTAFLFTVFLPGPGGGGRPVTHGDRPPWHLEAKAVKSLAEGAGFRVEGRQERMPRGQSLFVARPG